jgi:hypothetical protein
MTALGENPMTKLEKLTAELASADDAYAAAWDSYADDAYAEARAAADVVADAEAAELKQQEKTP